MKIKVFSKPNCMQCTFVKRALTQHGAEFEELDITQSSLYADEVQMMGFRQVPVVVAEGFEPFYGFKPDTLASVADTWKEGQV